MKPLCMDPRAFVPACFAALVFAPFALPTPAPKAAPRPRAIALPTPRATPPLGQATSFAITPEKSILRGAGEVLAIAEGRLRFDDRSGDGDLRIVLQTPDDDDAELRFRAEAIEPGPLPCVWRMRWRGGWQVAGEPFRPGEHADAWLCRLPGQPVRLLLTGNTGDARSPWLYADLSARRAR